jgi:hypothetical protein
MSNEYEAVRDRLQEIAKILAAGLTRLETRKSSPNSAEFGESSLHLTPSESGVGKRRSKEAQ